MMSLYLRDAVPRFDRLTNQRMLDFLMPDMCFEGWLWQSCNAAHRKNNRYLCKKPKIEHAFFDLADFFAGEGSMK